MKPILFLVIATATVLSFVPQANAGALVGKKIDVLFIADTSASASSSPYVYQAQVEKIALNLVRQKADFRIAMTTMDMSRSGEQGSLSGGAEILDSSTPDLESRLGNLLKTTMNRSGSSVERGLDAAEAALTKLPSFARSGSRLMIIFMNDEDDSSLRPVVHYMRFFDSLKERQHLRRWSANLIHPAGACANQWGDPFPQRLETLVNLTDGFEISTCP